MLPLLFASWVLLVSTTTLQCAGADCRPAGATLRDHAVATFATREACETFRGQLAAVAARNVQMDTPRPLTVRKDMTSLCKETP